MKKNWILYLLITQVYFVSLSCFIGLEKKSVDPILNILARDSIYKQSLEGAQISIANVSSIAPGDTHNCILFSQSGAIRCWGNNDSGQLGNGNNTSEINSLRNSDLDLENVTQISSGGAHTCAIFTDGKIKCWGSNSRGQLGTGNLINSNNAKAIPNLNVPFVIQVTAGTNHTCILNSERDARCFGSNSESQLGISGQSLITNASTASNYNFSSVLQIVAGANHTCALFTNGKMRCWGTNTNGQLGYGDNAPRTDANSTTLFLSNVSQISLGNSFSCVRFSDGKAKCWGLNSSGQLGIGSLENQSNAENAPLMNLSNIKQISTGNSHTCVLFETGRVRCFGQNSNGQLGIGNEISQNNPSNLNDLDIPEVSQVASKGNHTCVLFTSGAIRCWGQNANGQLGLSTTSQRNNAKTVGNTWFQRSILYNFDSGLPSDWSGNWGIISSGCYSGSCLRSPRIGSGQSSSISIARTVRSGNVQFFRKVSSEPNFDVCSFSIDGAVAFNGSVSGERTWLEETYSVREGKRTFSWNYSKDSSGNQGEDACTIDNVRFP